jgi:hypothetical protein
MSDWSIQLEEDFWDTANKVIGGCEYLGQFMQEMEPHRDWLGTHSNQEYADMLREAWDNYWSDKL